MYEIELAMYEIGHLCISDRTYCDVRSNFYVGDRAIDA